MRISAQAMDPDSVNTISILIQVGGKQAVALVDSGSNSTFMNLSFALKTSCTILKDKSRSVAVAGGGKLWSGAYIPDTYFTAAKHKFLQTFRILEIPGHDVVLGCDWLAKHSPTSFDHIQRSITVYKDRKLPVTIPACDTIANATEVDEKEMNKLIQKGAPGFALYLINTTLEKPIKATTVAEPTTASTVAEPTQASTVEKPTDSNNYKFLATPDIPVPISELLQRFPEVFAEPEGLPPVRAFDHEIPLQPGAVPPYSRPYRISHRHRNEMEHQVQKLISTSH